MRLGGCGVSGVWVCICECSEHWKWLNTVYMYICECSEHWEWLNTVYMDVLNAVNARNA